MNIEAKLGLDVFKLDTEPHIVINQEICQAECQAPFARSHPFAMFIEILMTLFCDIVEQRFLGHGGRCAEEYGDDRDQDDGRLHAECSSWSESDLIRIEHGPCDRLRAAPSAVSAY